MGRGQSFGGAFGIGTETTYATGVSPTVYVPIESESIKGDRPSTPSSGIYTTRTVQFQLPGIIDAKGSFVLEADAFHAGLPFLYWNGQISSASFSVFTNPPTVATAAGGTLSGTFYYIVADVLQRTSDSKYFFGSGSATSLSVAPAGGTGTVNVTWVTPTLPSGFTKYGTAVYRGTTNANQVFLAINVGAGTTYADDGSVTIGTAVPPATIYQHDYVPASPVAGTLPLPSFTIVKLADQAGTTSERYLGGRMGQFHLAVGDPAQPAKLTFDVMARNMDLVSNPSPSYTAIRPMMNWQAFASLDGGTYEALFEGVDITGNNNLAPVPGLSGNQYHRDFYPGIRDVSGSIKFGYENKNQWTRMINATEFALNVNCDGLPTTSNTSITSPITCSALLYGIQLYTPKCLYQSGGGHLNKAERMVETLPFKTANSTSTGYELKISLWNTTSTFA